MLKCQSFETFHKLKLKNEIFFYLMLACYVFIAKTEQLEHFENSFGIVIACKFFWNSYSLALGKSTAFLKSGRSFYSLKFVDFIVLALIYVLWCELVKNLKKQKSSLFRHMLSKLLMPKISNLDK